ncbi:hypothetical protein EJD97_002457 [Solanum chilense]|uniref:Gag-pol polyprotein n=1 Tax=Solanum chilense TaxID=4083 RepID=A0A6N2CJJ2_SOLCI|nr:hypothetical protein EJD97_002457 [Solanum chilense]
MNTRRNPSRRLEEEIVNAGVSHRGNQVPLLEEDVIDVQALVNPPPLTNGDKTTALFQMAQTISTQAQASTTQAQDMNTQDNKEVVPQANQYIGTMASHLRDSTRMNPPTFFGSKFEEDT